MRDIFFENILRYMYFRLHIVCLLIGLKQLKMTKVTPDRSFTSKTDVQFDDRNNVDNDLLNACAVNFIFKNVYFEEKNIIRI